jgi:hypothetical protein
MDGLCGELTVVVVNGLAVRAWDPETSVTWTVVYSLSSNVEGSLFPLLRNDSGE